jgi:hypothetical protein
MALIPLLLFLIVTAVLVVRAWRRFRGRGANRNRVPAAGTPVPDESMAGVPRFSVVALGTRGSGKTMLLSSMYHQLQTPSDRGFFLTAPYEQVMLLNQWFLKAADTGQDWPSGTAVAESRNFTFTVRTRTARGRVLPVIGLDYLEYAGGLLTDAQEPGSSRQAHLLSQIETAHALIGIIDGYWLRRWLIEGDPTGRARLQQGLSSMIGLMLMASCPVSFVITKWDLLRDLEVDENARLHQVRKRLMSNAGFRDLVQMHSARRVIRLIPVSAVGPDFAELDASGEVTKLPDGQLEPIGVDLPLSAVVPDLFAQVELEMDRAQLQAALDRIRAGSRMGPAAALTELGEFVNRRAFRVFATLVPGAGFLGDAALAFFDSDSSATIDRRLDLNEQLDQTMDDVQDLQHARRRVLRDLQSRVDVLEGRLPTSRLSAAED